VIVATSTDTYAKNRYSTENLYKVADVAALPPAEGCRLALQYIAGIASLG
jgi:hypothetical protein